MIVELVRSMDEIMENTDTIDKYLDDPGLRNYAVSLIKRGTFYLVIEKDNGLRFYPSRFIGYKRNSRTTHIQNRDKDVLDTNKRISEIVGFPPEKSDDLELEFKKYCAGLGFTATKTGAFGVPRKYWKV